MMERDVGLLLAWRRNVEQCVRTTPFWTVPTVTRPLSSPHFPTPFHKDCSLSLSLSVTPSPPPWQRRTDYNATALRLFFSFLGPFPAPIFLVPFPAPFACRYSSRRHRFSYFSSDIRLAPLDCFCACSSSLPYPLTWTTSLSSSLECPQPATDPDVFLPCPRR